MKLPVKIAQFLVSAMLILLPVNLPAQSAQLIDQILGEAQLSYGSAAYLILGATGNISEDATRQDAVETFTELGMGLPNAEIDDWLTLGQYSLLLMRVLEVEGGFAYTVSGESRFAARELAFLGAIQGRAFPGMSIDGARGMRILNRTLELREEGRL